MIGSRYYLTKHQKGDTTKKYTEPKMRCRFKDVAVATPVFISCCQPMGSLLHQIQSDELWHFYDGSPLTVHRLCSDGVYRSFVLGRNIGGGEHLRYGCRLKLVRCNRETGILLSDVPWLLGLSFRILKQQVKSYWRCIHNMPQSYAAWLIDICSNCHHSWGHRCKPYPNHWRWFVRCFEEVAFGSDLIAAAQRNVLKATFTWKGLPMAWWKFRETIKVV